MLKGYQKKFLDFVHLNEASVPGLRNLLESVAGRLGELKTSSQRQKRIVEMAVYELKQARLAERRLSEKLNLLEEQVKLLEEGRD
jgi:hypothetical protein